MSARRAGVLVIGSANMDLVLRVAALPAAGETVLAEDVVQRPGGKGANQAVAASLAGARVRMAGCLGDDGHGATVRTALADAGVDVALMGAAPDRPTGTAIVLVAADGENAIAVAPAANHAMTAGDVEALRAPVREAAVVLLQLELRREVVERAAAVAGEEGTPVILNAAPATDLPPALLERVDVLIVNRSEAATLLGEAEEPTALPAAAEALRRRGPAAVVVTAGGEGAVLCDAQGTVTVPAQPAEAVVDTTGAGDAFAGVLAAQLSQGADLRAALGPAVAAGAAAVAVEGAQLARLPASPGPAGIGA
jgi:ribokinase